MSHSVKNVLIVTASAPEGLPTMGSLVAGRLSQSQTRICILGRAKTGWGRLLNTIFSGLLLVPRSDVILVDVFGGRAFVYESAAILYSHLCKKRVVAMLHSGNMPDFVERWTRWTRFVLFKPALVLAPHSFLQLQLSALGLRIDGIIPNFIELENYPFRERAVLAPRFLYLRGMHSFYNAPMALKAFALIQDKYPEALLTLAGPEGEDSECCRALISTLNLRNVYLVGIVPKKEIPALADRHDIHLHTNRVENMPVSIIEMWACGLPIVGTEVGGMPHLVRNGQDGLLVESEDYHAMAGACLELLANQKLAQTLSSCGRARAKQLAWEHVRPAWERALFPEDELTADSTQNQVMFAHDLPDLPSAKLKEPDGTGR